MNNRGDKKHYDFNGTVLDNKETIKIYEEFDHFTYLLYHTKCRALIGKANILNRFDDFEIICHNCKKIIPVNQIKFVRIEKK